MLASNCLALNTLATEIPRWAKKKAHTYVKVSMRLTDSFKLGDCGDDFCDC